MKLLLVVNPVSGGIDKEPFVSAAKKMCYKYGINWKVFRTKGSNDGSGLKRELENFQPDKVASVGGDGTILFTGLVLRDTPYPMGIIPMGSANGMAKELNVAPDPIEALKELILSNITIDLDVLIVNDKYYTLHIGDVGFNAQVVHRFEEDPGRGMITYAKHFLSEVGKLIPFPVTVLANGKKTEASALMVAICNARKYGIGLPLNLTGTPVDGKFEVVIVKDIKLSSLMEIGLADLDQMLWDCQDSIVITTKKAKIKLKEPKFLQLDGEPVGNFSELDVKIEPGAIKLISNRAFTYIN